jgi:hypothetical protein
MKKILFTLVCLVGFSCLGFGQWEKVSLNFKEQPDINYLNEEFLSSTFYKDTLVVLSFQGNRKELLYSINYGKTWTKLSTPQYLNVSYFDKISMNQHGLFYTQTDSLNFNTSIYFSNDFGRSWKSPTFFNGAKIPHSARQIPKIVNYDGNTYLLFNSILEERTLFITYSISNKKSGIIYKYNNLNNSWSQYFDFSYSTISKNRIVTDSSGYAIVLDLETKKRLKSVKYGSLPLGAIDRTYFSQDSTIVSMIIQRSPNLINLSVSKDFGNTWNVNTISYTFEDKQRNEVLFNKNSIYLVTDKHLLQSIDFGQSWQYTDSSMTYKSEPDQYRINYYGINSFRDFQITDSILLVRNANTLFVKKNNNDWNVAYTLVQPFKNIFKVNDSIFFANNTYTFFTSKDKGLTWDYSPSYIENSNGVYSLNNKLYVQSGYLYSSKNYGKLWEKDSIFNGIYTGYNLIANDTMFVVRYNNEPIKMFSKPYTVGTDLFNTENISIPFVYSNGYLFRFVNKSTNNIPEGYLYRYSIAERKEEIVYSLSKTIKSITVNKNKIWITTG